MAKSDPPTPTDPPFDASFHFVPYPAGVKFASISCGTTAGNIRFTTPPPNDTNSGLLQPQSPIYRLDNKACAGNFILPLGLDPGIPEVVAITFSNNSSEDGVVTTVLALSFEPEVNQNRLIVKRTLKATESTFVHIVLKQV